MLTHERLGTRLRDYVIDGHYIIIDWLIKRMRELYVPGALPPLWERSWLGRRTLCWHNFF